MEVNKLYSDKKGMRITICIIGIALLFIACYLLYVLTGMDYDSLSSRKQLDSGWNVEYEGHEYSNVRLSQFKLPHSVDKGEKVILSGKVPDVSEFSMPVLILATHNTAVSVYTGNTYIYEYGIENFNQNKIVGSGYQYIHIDNDAAGKNIYIVLTASEKNAFSTIEPLILTEKSNVFSNQLVKYRVPFVFGIFLLLLGAAFMAIGFITGINSYSLFNYVWLGLLSVSIGIWTLCYYRLLQLYSVPMSYCTLIEHLALYIGAIAALMYFRAYVRELDNRVMMYLYNGLIIIQAAITVTAVVLNLFNIVHITAFVRYVQIIIALSCVYILAVIVASTKKGDKSGQYIAIGFAIFLGSVLIDIGSYMLKSNTGVKINSINGISAVAASAFILILFVTFGMDISKKLRVNAEREVLYRMAYTDSMTQIYNRRYCEEKMDELIESDVPYGIYNFDLNYLKKTNDNLGHSIGDELIKGFASILNETFGQRGTVARMGGDEFVVILEDVDKINNKAFIESLFSRIKLVNQKETRFQYSMSYGYADSHEVKKKAVLNGKENVKDPRDVYALADNRMYEYKRKYKESLEK